MATRSWSTPFLGPITAADANSDASKRALIILNQPFAPNLLARLWAHCAWRACADGGANRLHDALGARRDEYLPDLVKGDLDSLRDDVRAFYEGKGVSVVQDHDQDSTDLMKCIHALEEKERAEGTGEYELVILGGLSGRLDQTVHTLALLHKLRTSRARVFAVTDDTVGWVLDTGGHTIAVDHARVGPTCGLLPVGVDSAVLTTRGLRWNLDAQESGFGGLVSTSNHLVHAHESAYVQTSRPIWWCMELRAVD